MVKFFLSQRFVPEQEQGLTGYLRLPDFRLNYRQASFII